MVAVNFALIHFLTIAIDTSGGESFFAGELDLNAAHFCVHNFTLDNGSSQLIIVALFLMSQQIAVRLFQVSFTWYMNAFICRYGWLKKFHLAF